MVDRNLHEDRPESGQALAEYGLILALIAVVCVAALLLLGGALLAFFDYAISVWP